MASTPSPHALLLKTANQAMSLACTIADYLASEGKPPQDAPAGKASLTRTAYDEAQVQKHQQDRPRPLSHPSYYIHEALHLLENPDGVFPTHLDVNNVIARLRRALEAMPPREEVEVSVQRQPPTLDQFSNTPLPKGL